MNIVQCGFPRSGSTLLYLMLKHSVDNFNFFDRETSATKIKEDNTISKRPMDIFLYKEIMQKHKNVKFIINIRDPRSVLTSIHANSEGQYKVNWDYSLKTGHKGICGKTNGLKDYWDTIYNVPNSIFVYYEELVDNPNKVQEEIQNSIPEINYKDKFSDFHVQKPPPLLSHTLNGLRPPDPSTKYKWKNHPKRIKEQINKFPEILDMIVDLGYEKDKDWFSEYNK